MKIFDLKKKIFTITSYISKTVILGAFISIASCGGSNDTESNTGASINPTNPNISPSETIVTSTISIVKYLKLGETLVSGNIFDSIYQITIKNSGPKLNNILLTFAASNAEMLIIDGLVSIDELAAGASINPIDTITIRQDKTLKFDEKSLTAVLSNIVSVNPPLPPISELPSDLGVADDQTIIGIDSNSNGIRDDVERAIIIKYGNDTLNGKTLLQVARGMQTSSIVNTESLAVQAEAVRRAAAICAFDRFGDKEGFKLIGEIKVLQFNTLDRFKQEGEFIDLLRGRAIDSDNVPALSTC